MKNTQQLSDGIKKIKRVIEHFQRDFADKMPSELGVLCMFALVSDKGIFIEKVKYDAREIGVNIASIERSVIYKALSEKYKKLDAIERREQKKLITRQLKQIRKKK